MKTLLLDGSPKHKDSATMYLLKAMADRLSSRSALAWTDARRCNAQNVAAEMVASDAVIIGFPLYFDAIPSHLLQLLEQVEKHASSGACNTRIYVIVNCGFYEAKQISIAMEMMKLWCACCGFLWGSGVAAGAGGMLQAVPLGPGPFASLGKAFDALADAIVEKQSLDCMLVEPNFPRFMYMQSAHWGWHLTAKKNGVRRKQFAQKHAFEGWK